MGRSGLVNPLLDVVPGIEFGELRPFGHKVRQEIDARKRGGLVTKVAVFWQDLDNAQIFEISANSKFAPASLLKTPILIAALKKADATPGFLDRKVPYAAPPGDVAPNILSQLPPLVVGKEYSVDELLRVMTARSDNGAALTLYNLIGEEPLQRVYRDFGILIPDVRGPADSMSVREFSAFFRILYNASYLSREQSERALEYMAQSEFKQGLVTGVPLGVIVAHKFGERKDDGTRQLHDCGIVYEPEEPYILCIMTRGTSFEEQARTISSISRIVYDEVHAEAVKEQR